MNAALNNLERTITTSFENSGTPNDFYLTILERFHEILTIFGDYQDHLALKILKMSINH